MKIIIFTILYISMLAFSQPRGFIHPLKYDGSEEQKMKLIEYIDNSVFRSHCDGSHDNCHSMIMDFDKEENYRAFMELTKVSNAPYLEKVIKEYCGLGLFQCSYENILHAYKATLWCDKALIEYRENDPTSKYWVKDGNIIRQ